MAEKSMGIKNPTPQNLEKYPHDFLDFQTFFTTEKFIPTKIWQWYCIALANRYMIALAGFSFFAMILLQKSLKVKDFIDPKHTVYLSYIFIYYFVWKETAI